MHGAKDLSQLRQLLGRSERTRQRHSLFQVHFERHHMCFAQRVDRRVRHLRESLLAVIPQCSGQYGKKSRRRIVSHAPVRLFPAKQRRKENFELIFGPAGRPCHTLGIADRRRARTENFSNRPLRNSIVRLPRRHPLEHVAPA